MTASPGGRLTLEPVSASAGAARRWLNAALADCAEDEVEDAALLLTELVTNAVLHAQTQVDVSVGVANGRIRVEVSDASPVLPAAKGYGTDAATGRGLRLVDSLAERWGIAPVPGGKVVWFELGGGEPAPAGAQDAAPLGAAGTIAAAAPLPAPDAEAVAPDLIDVRLLDVPLDLLRRTSEHYDALLREFRLLAEQQPNSRAVPARLIALVDEL